MQVQILVAIVVDSNRQIKPVNKAAQIIIISFLTTAVPKPVRKSLLVSPHNLFCIVLTKAPHKDKSPYDINYC